MFDVITALYNKEAFVGPTVASVIAQSFTDWRLFVVDDGSSDGGPEIVRSFSDPRITLIRQDNRGVGLARNAAIEAGSSDLIAFLDADDVWNEDHLQELALLATEFPRASMLGCAFTPFTGTPNTRVRSQGGGDYHLARYFHECAKGRSPFCTSSLATRRRAIDAVGTFKPLNGNEDVELWARLAIHGPLAVSPKRTVNYRLETGGITDQSVRERKRSEGPVRRTDLSSAIPTLDALLPGITDPQLRADVNEYIDSRVGAAIVAAVRWGRMRDARRLRALYAGSPTGQAGRASLIASLPPPIGRIAVGLVMAIKRAIRHLRS
jgi:glycosyltransferase involved in cell wall biosynthesis